MTLFWKKKIQLSKWQKRIPRSILESIKNKIGKIDKKNNQLPDDVASEFEYVATNHEAEILILMMLG